MTLDVEPLKRLAILASNQYSTRDRRDRVKRKGSALKGSFTWQHSPNALVINDAVAQALLFDVPPERTIFGCREPARFCSITTRRTADALVLIDGDTETELPRVARWYRAREGSRRIERRFADGRRATVSGAQAVTLALDIPGNRLPDDLDWSWYIRAARRTVQGVSGYRHRSRRRLLDHPPAIEVATAGLLPVAKRGKEQPAGSDVKRPTLLWDWPGFPSVGCYTGPAAGTLVLDVDDPARFRRFVEDGNSPLFGDRWKTLAGALVSFHGDSTAAGVRTGQHRGKLIFRFDGDASHALGRVKSRWKGRHGIEVFYGNGLPSVLGDYDGNGDCYRLDGTLGDAPDWLVAALTPRRERIVRKAAAMAPEAHQAALEGLPATLAELAPELGDPSVGWRRKDVSDGREIWVGRCPFDHDSGRSEDGDLDAGYHEDGPYVRCLHGSCSRIGEINRRLRERHEREHPASTAEPGTDPAPVDTTTAAPAQSGDETQAQALLRLAVPAALWHTPDGRAYASLPVAGHREHHEVKSRGIRDWLTREFYADHGKPPTGEAMQGALGVLRAQALFDGPEEAASVRCAAAGDAYFLDLCDPPWRAVAIRPDCWGVSDPPVRFRRPPGLQALPEPRRGGSLELLRSHVNVRGDEFLLLVAWLAAAVRPSGPYPVLALTGEQGSAKSTLARMLRQLCDPHVCPLRSAPRKPRDLMISATNSWVVAIENISTIPPWLSDALCSLATGGGYATRSLWTDEEETFLDAMRPTVLNGIVDYATRGDLIDRCLFLHLATIPETDRRPEAELWRRWEADYPLILGALLDAVSGAIRRLPNVRPDRLPRMADFAVWAQAVCLALGWDPAEFTRSYQANRLHAHEAVLEDSPVAEAVRALVGQSGPWTGTATELLAALEPIAGEKVARTNRWPKGPRGLSGTLRRLAPTLRMVGVCVEFPERENVRRLISLTPTEQGGGEPSRPSPSSLASDSSGRSSDGRADQPSPTVTQPSPSSPGKTQGHDGGDGRDGRFPALSDGSPF
jgi:hypothetical protein